MAKPTIYPTDLYLVRDSDGFSHWYDADPMHLVDRSAAEIDIAQLLFSVFGVGSVQNPLRVRLSCLMMDRIEPFKAMSLVDIRNRALQMHVEQADGTPVEILQTKRSAYPDYPLTGVLLGADGAVTATRFYSLTGLCSDGDPEHMLLFVKDKEDVPAQRGMHLKMSR